MGKPSPLAHVGGCNDSASARMAIADESDQFSRNTTAVRPRLATRRPPDHDWRLNIGTATSISAATAIMLERIATFVRNSRAVIVSLPVDSHRRGTSPPLT